MGDLRREKIEEGINETESLPSLPTLKFNAYLGRGGINPDFISVVSYEEVNSYPVLENVAKRGKQMFSGKQTGRRTRKPRSNTPINFTIFPIFNTLTANYEISLAIFPYATHLVRDVSYYTAWYRI